LLDGCVGAACPSISTHASVELKAKLSRLDGRPPRTEMAAPVASFPQLGPYLNPTAKENAMVRDHPWRRPCSPSASWPGLWWLSVPKEPGSNSREPGLWLPTLTSDWSQSAAHTCGRAVTNDQPQRC